MTCNRPTSIISYLGLQTIVTVTQLREKLVSEGHLRSQSAYTPVQAKFRLMTSTASILFIHEGAGELATYTQFTGMAEVIMREVAAHVDRAAKGFSVSFEL